VVCTCVVEDSAVAGTRDACPAELDVRRLGQRIAQRTWCVAGVPTLHGAHLLALATRHGTLHTEQTTEAGRPAVTIS
jgi:hypothetical protein